MPKLYSEYLVFPLALLVVVGSYWLDLSHRNLAQTVFMQEEARLLEARSQEFATSIHKSLQHLEGVGASISRLTVAGRWHEVENILALLMLTNPDYMQARFINMQGHEVVRVNRSREGGLVRVAAAALQDKSSRGYTRRLLALPDRHFHVSRFDLNQENGAIEQPFRPTYRVGLRLGASESVGAGFLILNIAGERVLQPLGQTVFSDQPSTYLVNPQGFRPNAGYRWNAEQGVLARTSEERDNGLRVQRALAAEQAVWNGPDGGLWLTRPILLEDGRERSIDLEEQWYLVHEVPATAMALVLPGFESFHTVVLVVPMAALLLFLALRSGRLSRTAEMQARIKADMQVQLADRLERDVSRRTRQLQDTRNFIETLTDHLPMLIAFWNPELRCEFMNQSFADWYGADKRTSLKRHLKEFIGEAQYEQRQEPSQRALQGEPAHIEVMYLRASNGAERLLSIDYLPLGDGSLGFISVARDITDQRNAELTLQQRTRDAEQAAVAKDTFLSHMSHEIRTPMNAVLGMLGLLKDTSLDNLQRSYVDKSYHASESLLKILNDILDLSRLEAGRMPLETVDFELEEVLQRSVDLFALAAENKGLRLSVDVDMRLPDRLKGDPLRLGQILSNLVGNAIKFTAEGEIRLNIALKAEREEKLQVVFEVRDTGIGMTAEQQSHIFETFGQAGASTTRQFGGSGLGLSICRGLAERLGGILAVASLPGEGSTFTLELEMGVGSRARRYRDWELNALELCLADTSCFLGAGLEALIDAWGVQVRTLTPEALQQSPCGMGPNSVWLLGADQLQGLPSHWLAASGSVEKLPAIVVVVPPGQVSQGCAALSAMNVSCVAEPLTPARLYKALCNRLQGKGQPRMVSRGESEREPLPKLHVLVVDDLDVNCEIASRLLEKLGASSTAVESGEAALDAVATESFDAVLMDIHMSGMDGYEATAALLASRALPVIGLSASVQEKDRRAAMDAGMVGYLAKPLLIEDLYEQLRALFGAAPACAAHTETEATVEAASSVPEWDGWLAGLPTSVDPKRVRHQFGDDEELYLDCLQAFASSLRVMADGLEQAWKAGNPAEGKRLAHRLKGGAGTVANVRLEAAALRLEESLDQLGHWAGIETLLADMAQVEAECARLDTESAAGLQA